MDDPSLWCESHLPSEWKYICESKWTLLVGSAATTLLAYRSLRFLQWCVELLVGAIVRSVAIRIASRIARISWTVFRWLLGLLWMITEVSGAVAMAAIIGTFVYKYGWEGISPWDLLQSTEGDWWWWIDYTLGYYRLLESCSLRILDWGYHSIGDPEREESSSSDGMWWIERYYTITTSSSSSSWYDWSSFFNNNNSTDLA